MNREQFDAIFAEATAAIDRKYFLLPIDGGQPKARERVYCYELYHQLRLRWPEPCLYTLNGEVDKAGHPKFKELGFNGIPDFLVHQPGDMDGNHTIIEVKSSGANDEYIKNDLRKFFNFMTGAQYRRGIYLIYGEQLQSTIARIEECVRFFPNLPPVDLFTHSVAGQAAVLLKRIGRVA